MIATLWRLLRAAVLTAGAALCFFAVVELAQAGRLCYELHPLLGHLFIALLAAAALWLAWRLLRTFRAYPTVVRPPPACNLEEAGQPELRQRVRYLARVASRLSAHPLLGEPLQEELRREAGRLAEAHRRPGSREVLLDDIRSAERETIAPAFEQLDQAAEREVRACVRDVTVAVALSPWRSVDLLVVLYRNAGMVIRVTATYETRPAWRDQFAILGDVFMIVATVNILNYGSRLLQSLASGVPLLGRFADDVAQGVGAGLLTSVAGHAAMARCRAFRGWNQAAAESTIQSRLTDYVDDLKGIVARDLLPALRRPIEAQSPEQADRPDFVAVLRDGVLSAIDESVDMMDSFVCRPVAAAGRGVVSTGTRLGTVSVSALRGTWRAGSRLAGSCWRGAGRTAKGLWRKFKP